MTAQFTERSERKLYAGINPVNLRKQINRENRYIKRPFFEEFRTILIELPSEFYQELALITTFRRQIPNYHDF